jgi:glycosyltransferase involved in cell wall biosynthesis
VPPDVHYTGEVERGLTVVNHLARRGRRLGADIFERVRRDVPVDLVGMAAEESGGLGEVPFDELHRFAARYRFFFNPIRYTSLGLAVCEAMMIGMPIVGMATTEMPMTIFNGVCGYLATNPDDLIDAMQALLRDPGEARRLGQNARQLAMSRFNIQRFADDWTSAFLEVTGQEVSPRRQGGLEDSSFVSPASSAASVAKSGNSIERRVTA